MDSLLRNTLSPLGWAVMAAIPIAIFALYFLKLRRQPLEVPSTYLWHRVIEDLHVNSLWQRLRKSLLLLLQLLVATLAMLALLRPGWQGQTLVGQRFIFLVDNSASMSTTDGANHDPRIEEAKRRLTALIDQMESSMSAMIIAFAKDPVVIQEFTSNRGLLRAAVERIEPTSGQTDLSGALKLAHGFASLRRNESPELSDDETPPTTTVELLILSDGRFQPVENFSLDNLQPQFLPLGSKTTHNLAMTELNARREDDNPDRSQVFAQAYNGSSEPTDAVIELYLNDQLVDAQEVSVPARGTASATFLLSSDALGALRGVVDPSSSFEDRLNIDNVGYAVVETGRSSRVLLVTPGNRSLEAALTTERAQRLTKVEIIGPQDLAGTGFTRRVENGTYDLIIFDQCSPAAMPATNTLFIGRLPPLPIWSQPSQNTVFGPQIIDWDRSYTLLGAIELTGIQIADARVVQPPAGGRALIDSTAGPLMAIAPRDRFQDVVLGFEIVGTDENGQRTFNTDWPRKHSFPTFWLNVLEYFSQRDLAQATFRPGDRVEVRVPWPAEAVEFALPDGSRYPAEADFSGIVAFQQTERLGIYQVFQRGEVVRRFAVNLFDRNESDVALRVSEVGEDGLNRVENLTIGYVEVAAQSPHVNIRKELWKWLLLLALVVLILEWYIYNRRVYI